MKKEEIGIENIKNNLEKPEKNIENNAGEALKEIETHDTEEKEVMNEIEDRVEENEKNIQEKDSQKGFLSSLSEKVKKNKLIRAAVIGLSLSGASPAAAEVLNEITKPAESESIELNESERKGRQNMSEEYRKGFISHVDGKEYLDKLTREFDGDAEKAKEEQLARKKLLEEVDIDANKDVKEFMKEFEADENLKKNALGGYSYNKDTQETKIDILEDVPANGLTINHELSHASTAGNNRIPEKTKKMLTKSYESDGQDNREYEINPTERLARKQQLDLELQTLGVKNYGEEFTNQHYDEMMEMYEKDKFKFSSKARDFIELTKPDAETFKDIFNNIAMNQEKDGKKEQVA